MPVSRLHDPNMPPGRGHAFHHTTAWILSSSHCSARSPPIFELSGPGNAWSLGMSPAWGGLTDPLKDPGHRTRPGSNQFLMRPAILDYGPPITQLDRDPMKLSCKVMAQLLWIWRVQSRTWSRPDFPGAGIADYCTLEAPCSDPMR
jgi:hypothetical protein